MIDTLTRTNGQSDAASFLGGELGPGPHWLQALRQEARTQAVEIGFPATDHEEWRFTNMAPLRQWPLHTAQPAARQVVRADIEPFLLARDGYCLVFIDGQFRPDLSVLSAPGDPICVSSLRAQWEDDGSELEKYLAREAHCDLNYFTAVNTACFEDGAYISVQAKAEIEQPVQLLYLAASDRPGAAVHARNLIVARPDAASSAARTFTLRLLRRIRPASTRPAPNSIVSVIPAAASTAIDSSHRTEPVICSSSSGFTRAASRLTSAETLAMTPNFNGLNVNRSSTAAMPSRAGCISGQ